MKKTFFCILLALCMLNGNVSAQNGEDTYLRKIFKAIPADYFSIACCDGNADEYIKKHVTVENRRTGYMKGSDEDDDPQYQSFELVAYKRGEGSFIVGLHSQATTWSDYYFLDYLNGKIKNISKTIPQYSTANIYEFQEDGKTIKVYKKKLDYPRKPLGIDNSVNKGVWLYNMVWNGNEFTFSK